MHLPVVLEAVDQFPDRTGEQHCSAGRDKGRSFVDATPAAVIDPPLGQKGTAADRAKGRANRGALRPAGLAATPSFALHIADVMRAGIAPA